MGILQIETEIKRLLTLTGTHYFMAGEVKIRVSDHSANKQNNSTKTLSFISKRTEQNKSAYNQSVNEWVVLPNGLTDTYEEISYILDNEL